VVIRRNIIASDPLDPIMKEIDDTPVPENESECVREIHLTILALGLEQKLAELEKRVANLETRRVLQADPNDDEEWY